MTNHDLVRIVEAQGRQPVGIPVLLFTDETLAASDGGDARSVVAEAAGRNWAMTCGTWTCSPPSPTSCRPWREI